MRKHFLQSLKTQKRGQNINQGYSTILGFRSIIRDSGFNDINTDFERVDWLKCYWVKLHTAIRKFSQNHFGVWLSLARALALGARGPEFKSLYPDCRMAWTW